MSEGDLRTRLRAGLLAARKARDGVAVDALRSALAAIDNAEAVAAPAAPAEPVARNEHIAGSAGGLGAGEAARAELSEEATAALVAAEVDERLEGARLYDAHGRPDEAARLRAEAAVLSALLSARG